MAAVLSAVAVGALGSSRPWMDIRATPKERAQQLLKAMNVTEKLHLLAGNGTMKPYVGAVTGNARLGIPALTLNDGPQGFRGQMPMSPKGTSTAWPSGLTVGASWDVEMAREWGQGMGEEFLAKGSNVQLGPGVCLARIPYDGRNFEYISGEDPVLGMVMVGPAVEGIQSKGVIANAKHWVNNNQETNRTSQTANVDERTNFEIYYPPFEGAVNAGVGSVMCSYNLINLGGTGRRWSCENNVTLGHLKKTLGFEGWVMSDWGATHSASLVEGLDQEMPGGSKMKDVLDPIVLAGNISESYVDAAVLRVLTPMFQMGLFDRGEVGDIGANVTSPEHTALARKLASASTVLLKNDDKVLPINKQTIQSIAVFGGQAADPIVHGGGSGQVYPSWVSTPLAAIEEAFGASIPEPTACLTPQNITYNGADLTKAHVDSAAECCQACLKQEGCRAYTWYVGKNSTCYLKSKPNQPKPSTGRVVSAETAPASCPKGERCVIYNTGSNADSVATDAAAADISIVFIGTSSGEGRDRETLGFDNATNTLVEQVAASAKKVVVVMVSPGAVLTPWRTKVDGLLAAFMPGQEYGHAIADVLFGAVNPTAKLPLTFPDSEAQYGFTLKQWPGEPAVSPTCVVFPTPGSNANRCKTKDDPTKMEPHGSSTYSEGLLVGYRHFDAMGLQPAYEFGAGLSYTEWGYEKLSASPDGVSFTLTNKGGFSGSSGEIPQVYVSFPSAAGEPPLQLKGFVKVNVDAGAETVVQIPLTSRSFSTWDEKTHGWKQASGEFGIHVGRSSRDIRLNTTITL